MAYPIEPDQESIRRLHKLFANRTGTCWTCAKMVNYGTDKSTGKPIAWCGVKHQIVAPERGCKYYQPQLREVNK